MTHPMIPSSELQDEICRVAKSLEAYSTMVVIGIGGSSLGLRALVSALPRPPHPPLKTAGAGSNPLPQGEREIIICDDLDPVAFQSATRDIDWTKTVINIVSKSGGTLEIMALASCVVKKLQDTVGKDWVKHVVVTTDPKAGFLRQWATEHKLQTCQIPPDVGGRFSVFTAVGMVPLQWAGYAVHEIWKGAEQVLSESQPEQWAEQHVTWDRAGKPIAVIMPYAASLMEYARWLAQLWAESLGKDGKGQTPMVAVGSADQHSQLQMFAEGPRNKCVRFITVAQWPCDVTVPTPLDPAASYLSGKTFGQMLVAAAAATADALAQVGCPSYTIPLPALTAHALGRLMMGDILMTLAAAKHYGVNPFGQPGVELGKKLWRERLCLIPD